MKYIRVRLKYIAFERKYFTDFGNGFLSCSIKLKNFFANTSKSFLSKSQTMKVSDVVEALSSKYGFNAEEALEFIRSSRKPKLKIVEEAPKLKSILRKSYCKKRKTQRVKFEYGLKWSEDDEPLEEYSPPVDYLTMEYDVVDGYFVSKQE